ncbi:unnamed protein product [Caenorhabditis auriculariae]|uniref:Uncharacterized protein n=1 Tax=Caenorhabditis auriculariae TaxID=2777116 RepID=A0A8S1GPX7_9PELO|nr:unnamed protein product [Caenorhabditis auriculariae]
MWLLFPLLFFPVIPSTNGLGWAGWSPWTPCSKTCGGGVSQQLRRCLDTKCSGHAVRYRVCALKECESKNRWTRDTVCGGEEIVSKQQCEAATNRAVCSRGTCQVVGCDGMIGSSLRFDACGVCGGRGDTCESGKFVWNVSEEYTPCASNCDTAADWANAGREIAESHAIIVCINSATSRVVPERLCADRNKPKVPSRPCPPLICPSRWMPSDWSECLPHCGPGTRKRHVFCVQSSNNFTVHVPDSFCSDFKKPTSEESCTSTTCGKWETGHWSKCTTTCGQGVRRRNVECVGGSDCESSGRPAAESPCYAGIPCNALPSLVRPSSILDWNERTYLDGNSFGSLDPVSQSPRLIAGEWSECSATCGTGVASRSVECVAMHPITSAIIKLPMSECQSQTQPNLFQACEVRSCPLQEDAKLTSDNTPFQWQYGDWTQCSASCLGGKQKAALKCVEMSSGKSVQWSQCDARRRPPERSKICNQHPCPPFWQVGQFSECSASCGGGIAKRSVKCAQTVSKSGGADVHIILRDDKCVTRKPDEKDSCNVVSCPPTWVTGEWTECSKTCDSGERRRRVSCEVRDSKSRIERRPDVDCEAADRPPSVEMCSFGVCSKPHLFSNRVFEQNVDQKKLTIGIGGAATLYQGTSIKIKCPAKKFDKKKVYWTKNGKKIRNDAHIKVSGNGNLRVFHARMEDAGVYECYTDKLQGNVTLRFKYREHSAEQKPNLGRGAKNKGRKPMINTTMIEALLTAPNDVEATKELQKYGDLINARWDIGHWTECRQKTCHVAGYEARGVSCKATVGNEVRLVDNSICDSLASVRPAETRPCHREDCPRWEATPWSECSSTRCVSPYTAQQKRNVTCSFSNGTLAELDSCDVSNRPATFSDCPNQNCKAEWKTSEWGSCSSECGTGGVQLRLLFCTWASTGRPAGRNCESLRRPHSARACVADEPLPPCHATAAPMFLRDASCEDQSRFCDIIKLFHSCDSAEVRQKCCATCTFVERRKF